MPISIEDLKTLIASPSQSDVASALKAWRAHENFSQVEAAIRLGVSLRTLQGWEGGRSMPYPSLLEGRLNMSGRVRAPYSLNHVDFPHEAAEFIDFVGVDVLNNSLSRVFKKLDSLHPSTRSLYGDRFFFHEQISRFANDTPPFRLDIANPSAVRAASLIAGVNRVRRALPPSGASRLSQMIKDNLSPDRDIRQIEQEIRCATHFGRKGFAVTFADLTNIGTFDLLIDGPFGKAEVECKTVTEEIGGQIKTDLVVDISEKFRKSVQSNDSIRDSGMYTMRLNRPSSECKNLGLELQAIMQSAPNIVSNNKDFSIEFTRKPQWTSLVDARKFSELRRQLLSDFDDRAYCATQIHGVVVGLAIHPHKESVISERVVQVIKQAADQCSSELPAIIWLHFVGILEPQFQALAEFSLSSKGGGLNAIVANALFSRSGKTNRSHVHSVRFSADGRRIENGLSLAADLMMRPSVSSTGLCYEVPNTYSRFAMEIDA